MKIQRHSFERRESFWSSPILLNSHMCDIYAAIENRKHFKFPFLDKLPKLYELKSRQEVMLKTEAVDSSLARKRIRKFRLVSLCARRRMGEKWQGRRQEQAEWQCNFFFFLCETCHISRIFAESMNITSLLALIQTIISWNLLIFTSCQEKSYKFSRYSFETRTFGTYLKCFSLIMDFCSSLFLDIFCWVLCVSI